ncbi:hypothetical protein WICPIJ_001644 [Wickerhamomyces pijperi]|uniref:Uncharacterized protein n=1 Tax=Wickerhamomyces pijperi TaxID=599730 RepID=A0A9P8QB71_WICPI|nr:hypothetical protein WICPIJ_001644 [Wickerhamomyces pijperi]
MDLAGKEGVPILLLLAVMLWIFLKFMFLSTWLFSSFSTSVKSNMDMDLVISGTPVIDLANLANSGSLDSSAIISVSVSDISWLTLVIKLRMSIKTSGSADGVCLSM